MEGRRFLKTMDEQKKESQVQDELEKKEEEIASQIASKEEELKKLEAISKEYQRILSEIAQLREERRKLQELKKEEAISVYWEIQEKQLNKAFNKLVSEFPEAEQKREQILEAFKKLGSESIDIDELYEDLKKSYVVVDYDNFMKRIEEQGLKQQKIQQTLAQQSSASLGGTTSQQSEGLSEFEMELVQKLKKSPEEARQIAQKIKEKGTYFSR